MKGIFKMSIIVCALVCQFVNAESHDYRKFKNCSGADEVTISEMDNPKNIETTIVFNKNDYRFETIVYHYKVRLGKNLVTDSTCTTVDQNRKIILAVSKGSSTYCGGDWDQALNHPAWKVWGDDSNDGRQEFIPSFILEKVIASTQKQTVSEIDSFYSNFNCMYQPYNKADIEEVNNTAFYLSQLGQPQKAIELLNEVIKLDPNRAVAYFNIADSYIGIGQKYLAIKNYKKYVQLMKANKLDKKIPKRVWDAIK
jgi:tetratricopeptide (TPR) repeat protein